MGAQSNNRLAFNVVYETPVHTWIDRVFITKTDPGLESNQEENERSIRLDTFLPGESGLGR